MVDFSATKTQLLINKNEHVYSRNDRLDPWLKATQLEYYLIEYIIFKVIQCKYVFICLAYNSLQLLQYSI